MAADDKPLSRLTVAATSVADDGSYVAQADLSTALRGKDIHYGIIGGHMVNVLAARWQLGADLYPRDRRCRPRHSAGGCTRSHCHSTIWVSSATSAGRPPFRPNTGRRPSSSRERERRSPRGGNRCPRARLHEQSAREPTIRRRSYDYRRPGLAVALRRPPITLRLDVGRLNGDRLDVDLVVPDEIAALVLKNLATRVRHKVTDVVDVWRCLEIAFAAGVKASELIEGEPPRAADVVQHRTAALNLPASHWITGDTDLH